MNLVEEKHLVRQVLEGQDQAFSRLVKQYKRLVYHIVQRLANQQQDVEDICQEVFIKVFRHLSDFAFDSKLSTWIARIAYLTAINYLKKYRGVNYNDFSESDELMIWEGVDPLTYTINTDLSAYINNVISKLPEHYRLILTLYHIEEFSYDEIAKVTNLPEGTVKSHLFRARKLLKDKLLNYWHNERNGQTNR